MDIGEVVTKAAVPALEREKDPACNGGDTDPKWTSHVNKFNSRGHRCTGTQLYKNMNDVAYTQEKKGLGRVPPIKANTPLTLAFVTETFFPLQTHHLLPKSYLPTHRVCTWP